MDKYVNCIELHQSIINAIPDKSSICVQNMVNELNSYTLKPYQDIIKNGEVYIQSLNFNMLQYYDVYLSFHTGQTAKMLCDAIHKKLTNPDNCFCGGYGHHVFSRYWKFHPHWVIKPECYDQVQLTNDDKLALMIYQIDLKISDKAYYERWGN
jgi:hypothetical protein